MRTYQYLMNLYARKRIQYVESIGLYFIIYLFIVFVSKTTNANIFLSLIVTGIIIQMRSNHNNISLVSLYPYSAKEQKQNIFKMVFWDSLYAIVAILLITVAVNLIRFIFTFEFLIGPITMDSIISYLFSFIFFYFFLLTLMMNATPLISIKRRENFFITGISLFLCSGIEFVIICSLLNVSTESLIAFEALTNANQIPSHLIVLILLCLWTTMRSYFIFTWLEKRKKF